MSSPAKRKPHLWSRRTPTEACDDSTLGLPPTSPRDRFHKSPSGSMDDSGLNLRSHLASRGLAGPVPPSRPSQPVKSPKTSRFRKQKAGEGKPPAPTPKKGNRLKFWKKKESNNRERGYSQDNDDDDDDSGGMLAKYNAHQSKSFDEDDLSDVGMGDPLQSRSDDGYANSSDDGEGGRFSRGGRRGRGARRADFGSSKNAFASSASSKNVNFDFSAMGETNPTTTPTYTPRAERARYKADDGKDSKKIRVRPFHCFPEAKYMAEEDIYTDSLLPTPTENYDMLRSYLAPTISKSARRATVNGPTEKMWGSPKDDGRIGALRVEVLGCISLARQKPDVSVYLVCGDSAFNTDVLQGYRSPMWPKDSRRAAVFPVHHAYVSLYVGVFDVKTRKNKENDVYLGRIAIDIASLRPDTDYDITIPLRMSTFVYDRKKRGVIRLRFALHWFSERAAVVSYLKSPKSRLGSSSLEQGQPTIPCADPKTFRNVAVTVYGQDLPGKYTRNAFRATVREFNLYQVNLRYFLKHLVRGAVLYEKPIISFYLFCASMHCVIAGSVRMVPPYVVFYIMMLFVENYFHYVLRRKFNLGYTPLTAPEIAQGLLKNGSFEPLLANKRAKHRSQKAAQRMRRMNSTEIEEGGEDEGEIENMDHREFPFSERDKYPKFGVEDALAPSSKSAAGGNARMHGRLSVYYSATPTSPSEANAAAAPPEEDEDDDSSGEDSEDNDDETVISEGQMGDDGLFVGGDEGEMEPDPDPDDDDDGPGTSYGDSPYGDVKPSVSSTIRKIKVGPAQNSDEKGGGKKVTPQESLLQVERMLHKSSRGISVEMVNTPAAVAVEVTGSLSKSSAAQAQLDAIKAKKKVPLDEFDKLLQVKNSNPVHRIASSFLGPLMRMIRIPIYLMRVSLNVATWRDPYLSWWVFLFLSLLFLILLVFPWRSFFFLLSLVCLGPQNIFVRKYKERKKARKAAEAREAAEQADEDRLYGGSGQQEASYFNNKSFASKGSSASEALSTREDRPPFSSYRQAVSGKKLPPRAVVIPYSRLMKTRFYDWPPDPTVSRATPIMLAANSPSSAPTSEKTSASLRRKKSQ